MLLMLFTTLVVLFLVAGSSMTAVVLEPTTRTPLQPNCPLQQTKNDTTNVVNNIDIIVTRS